MRASVPADGWGNCFFFVVKIEGAGGFLVAGIFFAEKFKTVQF